MKSDNPISQAVQDMKLHPIFKGARFDLFSPVSDPKHLIVVLGQSHPVLTGSVNNSQLNQIVACQAKLTLIYAFFHAKFGINNFGGEGLYGDKNELYVAGGKTKPIFNETYVKFFPEKDAERLSLDEVYDVARKILTYFGSLWRDALRSKNPEMTAKYAALVDGKALYDYLTPDSITVYPVEGEQQYQFVLQNVRKLEQEIVALENNFDYRVAASKLKKTRKRKDFTDKEIDLLKKRAALVKEFNSILGSDFRERATLELMRDRAESAFISVFTMGVAHKRNYFQLVRQYLGNTQTAFLFITPPEIRYGFGWVTVLLVVVLIATVVAFYFLNGY